MKHSFRFLFVFCLFSSCVMDVFIPVFYIRNNTAKELKIVFSNDEKNDTDLLNQPSAVIFPMETYQAISGGKFSKSNYKDPNKKLYVFFFDNDTIKKWTNKVTIEELAQRSFLERKEINIRKIEPKDTIYFQDK